MDQRPNYSNYDSYRTAKSRNDSFQWLFWSMSLLAVFGSAAGMFLSWAQLNAGFKVTLEKLSLDRIFEKLNYTGIYDALKQIREYDSSSYSIFGFNLSELIPIDEILKYVQNILTILFVSMTIALILDVIYLLLVIFRAKKALPIMTFLTGAGNIAAWGMSYYCFERVNSKITAALNSASVLTRYLDIHVDDTALLDPGIGAKIALVCGIVMLFMLLMYGLSRFFIREGKNVL